MKNVFGIVLLFALASSVLGATPWFCHNLDCPEYLVVEVADLPANATFEVRSYRAQKWVSFNELNSEFDKSLMNGFNRLFNYISGSNEDGVKIPMTAPVFVQVLASQGPFCETNFTTSFFVPFAEQSGHVPQPKADSGLKVQSIAYSKVAVLSFGGRPDADAIRSKVLALGEQLDAAGLKYSSDEWAYAGYDGPDRIVNRHNEVWLPLV